MRRDDPLRPLPPERFGFWEARHLLMRAGFGGTPTQVQALADLGLEGAVSALLDWDAVPEPPIEQGLFDPDIMQPPSAEQLAMGRRARQQGDQIVLDQLQQDRQRRQIQDRQQLDAIRKWWLARMIETARPLQERLVLMWHGHFTSGHREVEDSYLLFRQNEFFRRHAAGNFGDLARGIVRDPAMLKYLDNDRNVRRAPNENLARELMELFLLGEGRGYDEEDIKEAARALTGYGVADHEFRFARPAHDAGEKKILGRRGTFDGESLVDLLLAQPIAREWIALKLHRFLVSDLPVESSSPGRRAVEAIASSLARHRWELRPVLRQILSSAYFYDAANSLSVVKSPIDLIVGSTRSLSMPVRPLSVLLSAADLMGQSLLQPPTVKGWSGGRAWINTSTLFVRQNLLVYMITGIAPEGLDLPSDGAAYDPQVLVEALAATSVAPMGGTLGEVESILRFCIGPVPRPERLASIKEFLRDVGDRLDRDRRLALLCLVTAIPEYQLS